MKRTGCPACGGTATVQAIDNHGRPYTGCASCVVVLGCHLCIAGPFNAAQLLEHLKTHAAHPSHRK